MKIQQRIGKLIFLFICFTIKFRKRNKSSGGVTDIKTESADSPRRLVSRPTSSFPGLPAPTSAKKTDPPPNFAKAAAGSVGSNDSR